MACCFYCEGLCGARLVSWHRFGLAVDELFQVGAVSAGVAAGSVNWGNLLSYACCLLLPAPSLSDVFAFCLYCSRGFQEGGRGSKKKRRLSLPCHLMQNEHHRQGLFTEEAPGKQGSAARHTLIENLAHGAPGGYCSSWMGGLPIHMRR